MVRGGALPCAPMVTTRRSERFYRLIGLIGTSRVVSRLHRHVYRLAGGRGFLGSNLGVLNVILISTGRTSGKRRETPLFAFKDGPSLVVIGSNAGSDREPAWVGNLRAQPLAHVLVGREERAVRARETDADERARLWAIAVRGYPGYEHYATWTERHIPVFALDPREA
jgi:F420H(2)-dependent quinone reductase